MKRDRNNQWIAAIVLALFCSFQMRVALAEETPPSEQAGPLIGGHVDLSGEVFLDANANGRKDPGETPLPDVFVSDGNDIIPTDAQGRFRFSFDLEAPTCVFVIEPNGYRASGSFYWLATQGTHEHSFGLVDDPESRSSRFTFVDGGDIQFDFVRHPEQLTSDLEQLREIQRVHDARFSVWPGDLTPYGKLDNLAFLKKSVSSSPRPFYPVFGGHDGIKSEPTKSAHYVQTMGPLAYSWNYGGVHFVGLVSEPYYQNDIEKERQSRWLDKDLSLLAKGTPIIVATHTPESMRGQLIDVVAKYGLKLVAVLRAHYHCHNMQISHGIPVFCSAPWRPQDWGAFTEKCRLIRYSDGELESFVRVLRQHKRLVIVSPQGTSTKAPALVAANVYDTVLLADAVDFQIRGDNGTAIDGQLEQKSDWTWSKPLDAPLSPGKYTITVTARAGEEGWQAQSTFEIDPAAKAPLELAWVASTGNNLYYFGAPVVDGDGVYLGLHDGQVGFERAGVVCLDLETGDERWRTQTEDDINSTVCVTDDGVYALSNSGTVYRLDKNTGRIMWASNFQAGFLKKQDSEFYWNMTLGPLTVVNDKIYGAGGSRGGMFCMDASNGKVIWYVLKAGYVPEPTAGLCVSGGRAFWESPRAGYGALDAATGKVLWREKIGNQRGISTPVASGEYVYFPYRGSVRKVAASDGALVWEYDAGGPINCIGRPRVAAESLVFAQGPTIQALDCATGKRLWSFETPLPGGLAGAQYQLLANVCSPAISGNHVFVGSDNGIFYVLDLQTGKPVCEYRIGVPMKSAVTVSGNQVVFSAFDGNVYSFLKP